MLTISTLVFEVVWEALILPPIPARIAVDQHGAFEEERRRCVQEAEAELGRLGLGTLRDVEPELADVLDVLARHDRAVGWREIVGTKRRAYLAASGTYGVKAVLEGDTVRLSRCRADYLVHHLVEMLPVVPIGVGRAFSIPTPTYQQAVQWAEAGVSGDALCARLRRAGVRADQAEQVEVLCRTTINTASVSAHRGRYGAVKLVGSVGYTDTSRGRYLLLQRPDQAGSSYTSIVPADDKVLRHHIADLLGTTNPW